LRGLAVPIVALALQVVITVVAPEGHPALHKAVHLATYGLLGVFLWSNRRLPGVRIIGTGTLLNALAIAANGGVMPATATAERLAGLHLRAGFDNSAHLAHAHLIWLGDVIPWPGPLNNVLSVGDCLIYLGTMVLLHRTCGRRAPEPIRLRPIPDGEAVVVRAALPSLSRTYAVP
jgi:hypothetical protein